MESNLFNIENITTASLLGILIFKIWDPSQRLEEKVSNLESQNKILRGQIVHNEEKLNNALIEIERLKSKPKNV